MKKTKVTEIVHKPLADQVIKLMQGQIDNPKKNGRNLLMINLVVLKMQKQSYILKVLMQC